MATKEDVKKLAALARIQVDEKELEKFTREFDAILDYVGQLESLKTGEEKGEKPPLHNVFREDGEPEVSGTHTQKLVEQFPAKKGDALLVKRIITHE